MGLSNYSASIRLVSNKEKDSLDSYDLLNNILDQELSIELTETLYDLFVNESQFNEKHCVVEVDKIQYKDLLTSDVFDSLKTMRDIFPWQDSGEKTLMIENKEEIAVIDAEILSVFLFNLINEIKKYKYHTEKPVLYNYLSEIRLVKIISDFCYKNHMEFQTIYI